MTIKRRRPRNVAHSFEGQLAARTAKLEEQAGDMAPGPARDQILASIRELKTAAAMNDWLRPPEQ